MEQEIRNILDKIDFVKTYVLLSKKFDNEECSFGNYSNEEILKILLSFDYVANYNRKEDFFSIIEKKGTYKFQLNIICKYGTVTFASGMTKNNKKIKLGGTWGTMVQMMGYEKKINKPVFCNYDDLQEILKEAFSIYEDFKKEVIKEMSQ